MKKTIIANWKMNPVSLDQALHLAGEIEKRTTGIKNAEVVIAPPYPFLKDIGRVLKKTKLGAQNMHWEEAGPYTGEVSWRQLKHFRVTHVIIGHSERRIHMGETDEMINKKIKAALKANLIPILAVGEQKKLSENAMRLVLSRQLSRGLAGITAHDFKKGAIAYEPVWAIGTGRAATPKHAGIALRMIQKILAGLWKTKKVTMPILYGGSVNSKNAADFISPTMGGMQGLLVGSASLNATEFTGIIKSSSPESF
ncbi:MAG: triose-phosphate isomerase [Candidatus Sungbacteria bacterium]|nr:triose-phosphate isomerase [Candidatus Sungbacteria bacterium]